MLFPLRHREYKAFKLNSPFGNMEWLATDAGSICQVFVKCFGGTTEEFVALRIYTGHFIADITNERWYASPFFPCRSVSISTIIFSHMLAWCKGVYNTTPCWHVIVSCISPKLSFCRMDRIFAWCNIFIYGILMWWIPAFRWFGKLRTKTRKFDAKQTLLLKATLKIWSELVVAVSVKGGISISSSTALFENIPAYLLNLDPSRLSN